MDAACVADIGIDIDHADADAGADAEPGGGACGTLCSSRPAGAPPRL